MFGWRVGAGLSISLVARLKATAVGVLIDSTTARIASKLYPDVKIFNESFGDTRPNGL
ncbi:Uncharacterised protein [Chlamydia trachomatis]|nr:Uncharacterised protein [Chlamydia trachomatis]